MTITSIEALAEHERIYVRDYSGETEFTKTPDGLWQNGKAIIAADLLAGAIAEGRAFSVVAMTPGVWLTHHRDPLHKRVLLAERDDVWWLLDVRPTGVTYTNATEAILRSSAWVHHDPATVTPEMSALYRLGTQLDASSREVNRAYNEISRLTNELDQARASREFPPEFVRRVQGIATDLDGESGLDSLLVDYDIGREMDITCDVRVYGTLDWEPDTAQALGHVTVPTGFSVGDVEGTVRVDWAGVLTVTKRGYSCICDDIDWEDFSDRVPDGENTDWELVRGCSGPSCANN